MGLENLFYPVIRERGRDYYINRHVLYWEHNEDYIYSIVKGTEDYRVILNHPLEEANFTCTCPFYEENGQYCKHMVATLLYDEWGEPFPTELGEEDLEHILAHCQSTMIYDYLRWLFKNNQSPQGNLAGLWMVYIAESYDQEIEMIITEWLDTIPSLEEIVLKISEDPNKTAHGYIAYHHRYHECKLYELVNKILNLFDAEKANWHIFYAVAQSLNRWARHCQQMIDQAQMDGPQCEMLIYAIGPAIDALVHVIEPTTEIVLQVIKSLVIGLPTAIQLVWLKYLLILHSDLSLPLDLMAQLVQAVRLPEFIEQAELYSEIALALRQRLEGVQSEWVAEYDTWLSELLIRLANQ